MASLEDWASSQLGQNQPPPQSGGSFNSLEDWATKQLGGGNATPQINLPAASLNATAGGSIGRASGGVGTGVPSIQNPAAPPKQDFISSLNPLAHNQYPTTFGQEITKTDTPIANAAGDINTFEDKLSTLINPNYTGHTQGNPLTNALAPALAVAQGIGGKINKALGHTQGDELTAAPIGQSLRGLPLIGMAELGAEQIPAVGDYLRKTPTRDVPVLNVPVRAAEAAVGALGVTGDVIAKPAAGFEMLGLQQAYRELTGNSTPELDKAYSKLINAVSRGSLAETEQTLRAKYGQEEARVPLAAAVFQGLSDPTTYLDVFKLAPSIRNIQEVQRTLQATADVSKIGEAVKDLNPLERTVLSVFKPTEIAEGTKVTDQALGLASKGELNPARRLATPFVTSPTAKLNNVITRVADNVITRMSDASMSVADKFKWMDLIKQAAQDDTRMTPALKEFMGEHGIVNSLDARRVIRAGLGFDSTKVANEYQTAQDLIAQLETASHAPYAADVANQITESAGKLSKDAGYRNAFQRPIDQWKEGKIDLNELRQNVDQLAGHRLSTDFIEHSANTLAKASGITPPNSVTKLVGKMRAYEGLMYLSTNIGALTNNITGDIGRLVMHGVTPRDLGAFYDRIGYKPLDDIGQLVKKAVGDTEGATRTAYGASLPQRVQNIPGLKQVNDLFNRSQVYGRELAWANSYERFMTNNFKYGVHFPELPQAIQEDIVARGGQKELKRVQANLEHARNVKEAQAAFGNNHTWQAYRDEIAQAKSEVMTAAHGQPVTITPEQAQEAHAIQDQVKLKSVMDNAAAKQAAGADPVTAFQEARKETTVADLEARRGDLVYQWSVANNANGVRSRQNADVLWSEIEAVEKRLDELKGATNVTPPVTPSDIPAVATAPVATSETTQKIKTPPPVVYHGTPNAGFTKFNEGLQNDLSLYGPGFYFTDNPRVASGYTVTKAGESAAVYPAKLDLKHPFDINASADEAIIKKLDALGGDFPVKADGTPDVADNQELYQLLADHFGTKTDVNDWLKQQGYDGITHIGGRGNAEKHQVWIAFDNNQIKPAFSEAAQEIGTLPLPAELQGTHFAQDWADMTDPQRQFAIGYHNAKLQELASGNPFPAGADTFTSGVNAGLQEIPAPKIPDYLPQPQSGYVRMYRGEGTSPANVPEWAKTNQGQWFTPDRTVAENYSKSRNGVLKYVDVPENVAAQTAEQGLQKEHILPDVWAKKAKLVPTEPPKSFADVTSAANEKGIATITQAGKPLDKHLLNVLNKHAEENGIAKFANMADVRARADDAFKVLDGYMPSQNAPQAIQDAVKDMKQEIDPDALKRQEDEWLKQRAPMPDTGAGMGQPSTNPQVIPSQGETNGTGRLQPLPMESAVVDNIAPNGIGSSERPVAMDNSTSPTTSADNLKRIYEEAKQAGATSAVDPQISKAWNDAQVEHTLDAIEQAKAGETVKPPMPPNLQALADQYIAKQYMPALNTAKLGANSAGRWGIESTVLNYDNRYNVDDTLNFAAPFTYWWLHSLLNYTKDFIEHPALLAYYVKLRQMMDKASEGMPDKYKHRVEMTMPFGMQLPNGLGNSLWVNPLQGIMPVDQVYNLTNMERAGYQSVKEDGSVDYNSAFSDMFGIHQPYKMAYWLATGQTDELGNLVASLPAARVFRALTQGIKPGGIGIDGKYDVFYYEKAMKELVADGTLTDEQAKVALLQQSGKDWDTIKSRAGMENYGVREVSGALGLRGYAFTPGEQKYLDAQKQKEQIQQDAVKQLGGNPNMTSEQRYSFLSGKGFYSTPTWLDFKQQYPETDTGSFINQAYTHPTDESGLSSVRMPQDEAQTARERSYYLSKISDAYWNAPELKQKLIANDLGNEFQTLFRNKDTRNLDAIPLKTVLGWANALDVMLQKPVAQTDNPTPDPFRITFTTPDQNKRYQEFYDNVENSIGWNNLHSVETGYFAITDKPTRALYLQQHPELKAEWDTEAKFYADNPDILKVAEQAGFKKPSTAASQTADPRGAALNQAVLAAGLNWDAIDAMKAEHDKLPVGTGARTAYLAAHPDLLRYYNLAAAIYGNTAPTSYNSGGTRTIYRTQQPARMPRVNNYNTHTPHLSIDYSTLVSLASLYQDINQQSGKQPFNYSRRIRAVN